MTIHTTTECRQGESHDAIEDRMQSTNKAFWKNILIFRSNDVQWKLKSRKLFGHILAVLPLGVRLGRGQKC